VLIVPAFPTLSETFVVSKFHGLLERGWDVHVACGRSEPREWHRFSQLPYSSELLRRVHVGWRHRPRWLAALGIPAALVRCLVRNPRGAWRYVQGGWRRFQLDVFRRLYLDADLVCLGPDLLHFEFGALAVDRMYLKDLLGCRVVVGFRGYDLNSVGLDNPDYYRQVWNTADALHCLGEDLWRRAQLRGCPPETPHFLIPPAIDATFFDPGEKVHAEVLGSADRPLRILSVGRLDWKKGYEYALEAVERLTGRGVNCEYRIIGDGDYLDAVTFARSQLGLEAIVELQGARPRQEVKAEMLWADVFLHAAVSEGFCNAVMEAQAMAVPVVCSDAGGLPENVASGETGFVVPRRDPDALAEKLLMLAGDPGLRHRMGQAGRRRVLARFRLADQIAAFDRLYREVLAMDRPAREKAYLEGAGREAVLGK
ncbi:MAG: glycosyltransferase family 4 protein, partial [Candidatus Methylomirabilis sp.]